MYELMHVSLVLLLSPSFLTIFSAQPLPPDTITSPSRCLSSYECSPSTYCDVSGIAENSWLTMLTCLPQKSLFDDCDPFSPGSCKNGTMCEYREDVTCLPILKTGDKCAVLKGAIYPGDGVCSSSDRCKYVGTSKILKCVPFTTGYEGDQCYADSDGDKCQKGFFCDEKAEKCTKLKSVGEPCNSTTYVYPDNPQCDGFCSRSVSGIEAESICTPAQPEGGMCSITYHCEKGNTTHGMLLCNVPSGKTGICVREGKLLKSLGASCNPKADACDARRGLRCRFYKGKPVCQHYGSIYCDPKSKYSTCTPTNGYQTHCVPLRPYHYTYSVEFISLREIPMVHHCYKKDIAKAGTMCNTEGPGVTCEEGLSCLKIPGVKDWNSKNSNYRACVSVRKLGQDCGDKFTTQCDTGLICNKGKCVKGDTPTEKFTHIRYYTYCKGYSLPCVPGSTCRDEFCFLPLKIAKAGESCLSTLVMEMKCDEGLKCLRSYTGSGELLCREPFQAGGVCTSDDECQPGLKCSPRRKVSPFKRVCYDPSKLVLPGEKCNPKASPSSKQCVVGPFKMYYGTSSESLSCLEVSGQFRCVFPSGLFEYCNTKLNQVCADKRLVCSSYNVCIPR